MAISRPRALTSFQGPAQKVDVVVVGSGGGVVVVGGIVIG